MHGERASERRHASADRPRLPQLARSHYARRTHHPSTHLAQQVAAAMPKRAAKEAPAKEAAAAEGDSPSTSGAELSRVVYLGCVRGSHSRPAS